MWELGFDAVSNIHYGNCSTVALGIEYIKDLLSQEKQSNNTLEYYNLVKNLVLKLVNSFWLSL
jgi:hypothetical protein